MKKKNPYTLYRLNKDNILVEVNLEEELTQLGLTVGEVLAALASTQKQLAQTQKQIRDFLDKAGAENLEEVNYINPQYKYLAVLADGESNIEKVAVIDTNVVIIRDENYDLKEIVKGYHKIENKKVVEDQERKIFRHL